MDARLYPFFPGSHICIGYIPLPPKFTFFSRLSSSAYGYCSIVNYAANRPYVNNWYLLASAYHVSVHIEVDTDEKPNLEPRYAFGYACCPPHGGARSVPGQSQEKSTASNDEIQVRQLERALEPSRAHHDAGAAQTSSRDTTQLTSTSTPAA